MTRPARERNTLDFVARLSAIAEDRSHGAAELACQCLDLMADSARLTPVPQTEAGPAMAALYRRLGEQAEQLAASRPSMTPIQTLLLRWQERLAELPATTLVEARCQAAEAAQGLAEESRAALGKVAAQARSLIGAGQTLLTHSLSSTVLAVFRSLPAAHVRAIVTESRPLYEGRRLAARLSDWGIPTSLITDAQLGLFVPQADMVLIGADSILADGSVINKAGTYGLALVAHDQGVPVYVCAESCKRRPAQLPEPALEEMDPAELSPGEPSLGPHVRVRNIYFDRTPARLISGWIDEHGVQLNSPSESRAS